jgi:hypothetical protein
MSGMQLIDNKEKRHLQNYTNKHREIKEVISHLIKRMRK